MDLGLTQRRSAIVVGIIALVLAAGIAVVVSQESSGGASAAVTPSTTDTVSVSGTGTAQGAPDTLVASLRVHVKGASVQEALNMSALDTHKVIGVLHSHGVALTDIKTTDLSLNPHYDMHGNVDGYDSSESLSVRIHPLNKVGQVLSAASTSAGNSVSIDGLSFDFSNNNALLSAARKVAFDNAKAAAAQYASLGGRSLARVMTIKAVVHNPTPIYASAGLTATDSLMKRAVAAIPIRPGQKKVSVIVSVVWALQ